MRTSIRQADPQADLHEEFYVTDGGVGRVLLAGDLPLELDLPDVSRPAPVGRARGSWVELLERYFAGEPVAFPLDVAAHCRAHGFTSFESDVYEALARVPYGTAVSYRDLAHAAGRPNAYRAVGSAMARNELPIILPCHRVVKNDGRPGFYGDDPRWKVKLLQLEGVLAPGEAKVRRTAPAYGRRKAGAGTAGGH
jgi:methylated-DNA-[protein]-cysteine S-methyltransferase